MTVVLGKRLDDTPDASHAGPHNHIDHTRCWEERRRQYHLAHVPSSYPTWQPGQGLHRAAPVADQAVVPEVEPVRPGLLRLYAARQAHAQVAGPPARYAGPGERLVVGEAATDGKSVRSMAVLGTTSRIGRGADRHYQRLHPRTTLSLGRLRSGTRMMSSTGQQADEIGSPVPPVKGSSFVRARIRFGSPDFARIGTSRRMMFATFLAIVVIISAASSSLASQFRYEVQNGDTIESIAETFGVDADAIRASSYLPTGDALEAGQVVIIPEQGQSPGEAAQMAAQNEGTSPWVAGVHVVEQGENPGRIAAMYGVTTSELMDFNGIDDPLELTPGTLLYIPGSATTAPSGSAVAPEEINASVTVPAYKQRRNLSCEYAATHAAAMAFGWGPTEEDFMAAIPETLNPHRGYRGNIDGWWGNTTDYGIYPEALAPVLNDWGFNADVFYSFGDTSQLIAELDAGHPVVTWLGFWGNTRERLTDDGNYSVFAGMHVVTVYGYDDDGVWVMDPAKGKKVHYTWDFFVRIWKVVDGMSMAVYPS